MKKIRLMAAWVLITLLLMASAATVLAGQREEGESVFGEFRYVKIGTGMVITKYRGSAAEVDVPERIENVPVRAIDAEAFAWNPRVEHVVLPDTVQFIGLSAFVGCDHLEEVEWSEVLRGIGREAFMDCTALRRVDLPGVTSYIGEAAFSGCTALEEVTLPKSLYDVGPKSFRDCTSLRTAAILGDATTGTIFPEDAPFAGCASLEQFSYGGTAQDLCEILPSEMQESVAVFFIQQNEIAESIEITACDVPAGELVLPETIGGVRLASFGDHVFAEDAEIGRIFYPGTKTSWDRIDRGEGNALLDDVICLGRDPESAVLSPVWNDAEHFVTGISIADLGDMPLRGTDLVHAQWAEPQPPPDEPDTPGADEPDTPGADEPDTPGANEPDTPGADEPDTPGTDEPDSPGANEPDTPGTDEPDSPGANEPDAPGTDEPETPGADEPGQSAEGNLLETASTDVLGLLPEDGTPETPEMSFSFAFFDQEEEELSVYDILGTGCKVTRTSEKREEEALIVVAGDVTGAGIINVTQLVRLAQALSGADPLDGAYLAAADVDGSGKLDIADLTTEAVWLLEYGMPAA